MNKVIEQKTDGSTGGPDDRQRWMCEIHSFWSEDEFFNQAINLPHPSGAEPILPDRIKIAIPKIFSPSAPKNGRRCKEQSLTAYITALEN